MHVYVKLAYDVIKSELEENYSFEKEKYALNEKFQVKRSCFVTLHNQDGSLRGCIGTIEPYYDNLYLEISHNAISAAFKDPRFPAVTKEEFSQISISVDVLGELKKVNSVEELDPTKYGIVIKKDYRKGVLLPNLDGVDTVKKQIEITKMKAGIESNDYEIFKFEVNRYE
ncbi:MAG: AmmeMemoRadiSam system protein A [Thermotogota bacterium]